MSRNAAAACGTTASVVTAAVACAGQQRTSGVASVLRDKDSIIRAQAKHIGQLEREAERVRKERDSLATKVALLTYKLQMYSKDLHGRQTMNFTERKQTSESTGRRLESSSSSSSSSYSSSRTPAAPTSRQPPPGGHCGQGRPLPPPSSHPKTGAPARSSPSSDKLLQPRSHHRVQKRTSDEDEKIKRSRDWDYELSQDLQAKQIEMLEKKYGGALRARRAARIIQQAYRQYCLNKNFAKLRLEADSRRLSRRFTDFGRSKTLWTDMVMTNMEYGGGGTPPPVVQHLASSGSATASFSNPVYGNSGTDVRPDDASCSRVITHSSAAFSNYYCKVLQKSLTMSVSSASSEHTTVVVPREAPQPPVRHTPTSADLGMIREMGCHDGGGFRSGELERSRSEQRRAQTSESSQRIASSSAQSRLENEADLSVWLVEKSEPVCGYNGNDDDEVVMAMGAMSSYVDHNSIDNNLDFDIEGNAPEPPYLGYADLPPMMSESPYCEQHKCIPLGMMPMGHQQSSSDPHPGYYDGGGPIQVCRIPMSSMAPPPQTSCSPSNHVYSSLRLCSLRHGASSPSVPAVENLAASRQPSTGSPVWKRKNVGGDGFSYVYEAADPRGGSDHHPPDHLGGCGSSALTVGMSAAAQVGGGIVAPQGAAYMARGGGGAPLAACTDCAQLLHHYHRHHHHHHHHHLLQQQQAKVSDKQRKRTYRIGLNLFNKKPEKGIRYLIERRFLDNRPNAVARFLISRKGLSKQMIGEYLGNLQKQFNMEVLRCFADEIDLANLDVDVALRKFQSYFRMPGEAQKIERLMEAFASQYCQCNPNVVRTFRRADTVFLLAFATIMLNTDLHNKSIKAERRMKLTEFIRNLRGIDDGEDIDANLLTGIYERMRVSEFQPGSDHVTQVAKVEASIVGKKPQLAALHRRLVCYCRLYEVQDLSRREKLGLHQREVFLFNDMLMVTKILGKKKNSVSYSFRSSFSLSGMGVYLFDTAHYKYGIRLVCSSSKKDYVMLYARNEHDRTKFVEDLKDAILEMNEMEALRIEEELQKQKVQQKHCNYNRHSKDSGVVDIEMLRPSDFAINRHSTADCVSVGRAPISGSLVDMTECGHHGSAGSLDSGLVSIHAQCDHIAG